MLFIIIGQARGLKEQSASEGGQGKKAFKNYTKKNNKKKPTKKKKKKKNYTEGKISFVFYVFDKIFYILGFP